MSFFIIIFCGERPLRGGLRHPSRPRVRCPTICRGSTEAVKRAELSGADTGGMRFLACYSDQEIGFFYFPFFSKSSWGSLRGVLSRTSLNGDNGAEPREGRSENLRIVRLALSASFLGTSPEGGGFGRGSIGDPFGAIFQNLLQFS